MIRSILSKFNIESYSFICSDKCRTANSRLRESIPEGANVIFMLFPYYCGDCGGKISAYGAVYDYHAFAREVFSALECYFRESYPDTFARGFSDHSPFLECEGAAMAGLGIIGENSLLITEKYSSYVFVGEFITTLSREALLSEGIPEGDGRADRCESCGICALACPGGCCGSTERDTCASSVSQKKGELTDAEAALLKSAGSIWGCDVCQKVCPHTKKAKKAGTVYTPIGFFKNSYIGDTESDPSDVILKMDGDTFARYPFSWRNRSVIGRNIEIIDRERTEEKND